MQDEEQNWRDSYLQCLPLLLLLNHRVPIPPHPGVTREKLGAVYPTKAATQARLLETRDELNRLQEIINTRKRSQGVAGTV